jgi:Cd(II)/Pb(II)-responsive transcriptional regulator
MDKLLRIGELARQTGCQTETIRFYESAGLLPAPGRSAANYRLYGAAHAERLGFIRHCRALDMTLDEIRALLALRDGDGADCSAVDALLDEHIGHVAQKIAALQELQAELQGLRGRCKSTRPAGDCAILQGLAGSATPPRRKAAGCC